MFPDANQFVIQGGTFHEQHYHIASPSPIPGISPLNSPPDLGERPTNLKEVLSSGIYHFQNCEKPEAITNAAYVRCVHDIPGVVEIYEVGYPGKAWVVSGNVCTVGEKPSRWFFDKGSAHSEWLYIRPYDKPSKAVSGHCVYGSKYGDSFLEDIELGAPIQLFKPIPVDLPLNSGIVPPGYYFFQNLQTGNKSSLAHVRYKKGEIAVAVIAEVEMPGLYWTFTGNACTATRKPSEWHFETMESEVGGSGIFYIYPRHQPKRVVSGEAIQGTPLGDFSTQDRAPNPDRLQLWKAIPLNLPENSGVLPAGIYKFVNAGTKFQTNPALVRYSDIPGKIGVATISVISHPGMYWLATEVTCTGGNVPSEWFFQSLKENIYYICPINQPYPQMKVLSGETIDGEATGDYLIQDKILDLDDMSALSQVWVALKQ